MTRLKRIAFAVVATINLVGCGEKFDASSEEMFKISYHKVLKSLDEDDQARAEQQFRFFFTPYEDRCGDESQVCIRNRDKAELHDMSYSDVLDMIAAHKDYAEKVIYDKKIRELKALHAAAVTHSHNVNHVFSNIDYDYKASVHEGGDGQWYSGEVFTGINRSTFDLTSISADVTCTYRTRAVNEKNQFIEGFDYSTRKYVERVKDIKAGESKEAYADISLTSEYGAKKYKENVECAPDPDGSYYFNVMKSDFDKFHFTRSDEEKYHQLKNEFSTEFKEIEKTLGIADVYE